MEEKHGNEQWFIKTHIVLKNNFSFKIVYSNKIYKKKSIKHMKII